MGSSKNGSAKRTNVFSLGEIEVARAASRVPHHTSFTQIKQERSLIRFHPSKKTRHWIWTTDATPIHCHLAMPPPTASLCMALGPSPPKTELLVPPSTQAL